MFEGIGKSRHCIVKALKCVRGMVFVLAIVTHAEAKELGRITNGHESEDSRYQTEEYQHRYYISCVSNVENASVFTEPNYGKVYKGASGTEKISFQKGTDFSVDNIIEVEGKQFLAGKVIRYAAGGAVLSLEKPKSEYGGLEADADRLYVLPMEWDCRLYKGSEEASCSSDAAVAAYARLYKKYKAECKYQGEQ